MRYVNRLAAAISVPFLLGFMFSAAQAQDIRTTLFKDTDALMQQAKDARAELLSPNNYAAAEKAYKEAEKQVSSGRADRAEKSLSEANKKLSEALEASYRAAWMDRSVMVGAWPESGLFGSHLSVMFWNRPPSAS